MCSHTENLFKLGIKTYLSSQDLKSDLNYKTILSHHYENLNLYKKRIEKIFQVIKNFYTIKQKYTSNNNDHSSNGSGSSNNNNTNGRSPLNYVECQECMTHQHENENHHLISSRHHICLNCLYIGCFNFSNYSHTREHFKKNDHAISIDMVYGSVYCFHCMDYQYDEKIEEIISDFLRSENFFLGGKFDVYFKLSLITPLISTFSQSSNDIVRDFLSYRSVFKT